MFLVLSCKKEEKKNIPNYNCSNLITLFDSGSDAKTKIANGCENKVDGSAASAFRSTVGIKIDYRFNNRVKSTVCSGVAITKNSILTAAHCFKNINIDNYISTKITSSTKINDNKNISVENYSKNIKINPIYDFAEMSNIEVAPIGDIAIIHTDFPLSNINVIPVKIAKNYTEGKKVLTIGYGANAKKEINDGIGSRRWTVATLKNPTPDKPYNNGENMRYENAKLIDRSIAPSIKDSFLIINRENHYEGLTCDGDSGGPQYVYRNNQAALITITQGITPKLRAGNAIYEENGDDCIKGGSNDNTYVAAYIPWIISELNKFSENPEFID